MPDPAKSLIDKALRDGGLPELDREVLALFTNRVSFAESFMQDRLGKPWRTRPYQRSSLQSHALRKVHCDGRDVGKTAEIEIITAWAVHALPGRDILIATQTENHLFPLMHRLARLFELHPSFAPSLAEIRRSPSWFFRFHNGAKLWGRIAGPRGTNFQGLHVDWQIIDEAQEMTETAWGELLQALNGGGRRWVYGVPNGQRNTFYRMTQDPDAERYNWPSTLNPDYTEEKDAELIRLYGGKDSPGYIHRVLGRHGEAAHGVFALDDFLQCVDGSVPFSQQILREEDPFEAPVGIPHAAYFLGCDLGYARDPSEFMVYQSAPPYLINVARVRLEGVNYARQASIIEELNRAYQFEAIGIDAGNNGRAVAHQLLAGDGAWQGRLHAIEFGALIETWSLDNGPCLKRRCKEFMTELLRKRMHERTIRFPTLPDRESQYAAHTYRVNSSGAILYDKGNDHIIDADRCALLAHYFHNHPTPTREIWRPRPGMGIAGF